MRRFSFSLTLLLPLMASPSHADTDEVLEACRGLGVESLLQTFLLGRVAALPTNLIEFCDALRERDEETARLAERVEVLESNMPPRDAIVLVDHPDGCPDGWADMAADDPAKFAGRMALAAINSEAEGPYHYRETGGDATHVLTLGQLPSHGHVYRDFFWLQDQGTADRNQVATDLIISSGEGASGTDRGNTGWYRETTTSATGNGEAHNNMPPFIALYFCKRQ